MDEFLKQSKIYKEFIFPEDCLDVADAPDRDG